MGKKGFVTASILAVRPLTLDKLIFSYKIRDRMAESIVFVVEGEILR